MFTGIVEEIGTIKNIKRGSKSSSLTITCKEVLEDLSIGDSISTNGVCLTATSLSNNFFTADVMNETLSRSSLGQLQVGNFVNLERAMINNGRFGGHIVSGHIDGTGKILEIKKDDIAIWYTIKTSQKIMRYIIEKGSIAIDGISLTVAKVQSDTFCVSVIPHTIKKTILPHKNVGSLVNLENDIIGKYIEKLLPVKSTITKEFLINNGF